MNTLLIAVKAFVALGCLEYGKTSKPNERALMKKECPTKQGEMYYGEICPETASFYRKKAEAMEADEKFQKECPRLIEEMRRLAK